MFFSVMAAIKYNEDEFCKNSYYALVAGLPVKEFNYLEQMFMRGIDYSLYVSKYNYDVYESYFIKNEDLQKKAFKEFKEFKEVIEYVD